MFSNPRYAKGELADNFKRLHGLEMSCEKWAKMTFLPIGSEQSDAHASAGPLFSVGVKTIIESSGGHKIIPHDVIVIEMKQGDDIASFDFNANAARLLAKRLNEYADSIGRT